MRRSAWHLKEASAALIQSRVRRTTTTCVSPASWDSQLRALLNAFDTPWTHHARQQRQYLIPSHRPYRHSPFSCTQQRHSSSAALSTEHCTTRSPRLPATSLHRGQHDDPIPSESLALLNFSYHVGLADLEHAIAARKAESAWSLFKTLSRGNYIPLPLCSSLYSVMAYAKALAGGEQVTGYRQRQIEQLLQYIEATFEIPRTKFMADADVIAVPAHKLLQRAVRRRNMRMAWSVYMDMDDWTAVPLNTVFRIMSLVQQQRELGSAEKKHRLDLLAQRHAGIVEHGRTLTADELLQIGKVYYHLDIGDYRTARGLMTMQAATISPDALAELVRRAIEFNAVKPARDLVHSRCSSMAVDDSEPDPRFEAAHVNLIDAMRRRGQYTEALEVFEAMLKAGIRPGLDSFNAVIHVYATQGMADKAADLVQAMKELGVAGDVVTYAHLILAHRKAGDMRAAVQYYYTMQDHGIQPNRYHYSILIDAFAKRHDARSVLRWVKAMTRREIPVNEVIVTSILKAFRSRHERHFNELVLTVADHAMAAGIKANAILYTILLMVQADLSGLDGALRVHREMLSRCVEPTVHTYTVLVHLCGVYHAPEMAVRIFDLMKQSDRHPPDTVTYMAMMDVWLRAQQEDKARQVLHEFLAERKKDTQDRLWIDAKLREYITAFS